MLKVLEQKFALVLIILNHGDLIVNFLSELLIIMSLFVQSIYSLLALSCESFFVLDVELNKNQVLLVEKIFRDAVMVLGSDVGLIQQDLFNLT